MALNFCSIAKFSQLWIEASSLMPSCLFANAKYQRHFGISDANPVSHGFKQFEVIAAQRIARPIQRPVAATSRPLAFIKLRLLKIALLTLLL